MNRVEGLCKGRKAYVCLNEIVSGEFDDRIIKTLRENAPANQNIIQVDYDLIPCYQEILDFIENGFVIVTKNQSSDFQTTCSYFNLLELKDYTKIYFEEGSCSFYWI